MTGLDQNKQARRHTQRRKHKNRGERRRTWWWHTRATESPYQNHQGQHSTCKMIFVPTLPHPDLIPRDKKALTYSPVHCDGIIFRLFFIAEQATGNFWDGACEQERHNGEYTGCVTVPCRFIIRRRISIKGHTRTRDVHYFCFVHYSHAVGAMLVTPVDDVHPSPDGVSTDGFGSKVVVGFPGARRRRCCRVCRHSHSCSTSTTSTVRVG